MAVATTIKLRQWGLVSISTRRLQQKKKKKEEDYSTCSSYVV